MMVYLNTALLIASLVLWPIAAKWRWLENVKFVSHISMAALVYSAIAGIAAS